MHCAYLVQPHQKGLGDAILQAEEWTGGESFVVAPQPALLSPALGAAALGFTACGIPVSPEIATAMETQFQEAKSNGTIANA